MRETRIRTFIQLELKACLYEIDWTIRCHNCAANNCSEEEYPARPSPIPPGYIDILQSRLVKVNKGILPPSLKMIFKTYYHLPGRQAPVISPAVQPDDMMGRHLDEEHSLLERPQASEKEENVVADGPLSIDQERDFFFQTEIGKDSETSQVTARRFALPIDRQQKEVILRSTDKGGDYPTEADFGGNPTATAAQVIAREKAAIGRHHRGTALTDQSKQFDSGGDGWTVHLCQVAMLYTVCSRVHYPLCLLAISLVIIPGIKGNTSYPLKTRAIGIRKPEEHFFIYPWDHLDSRFKRVLLYVYCSIILRRFQRRYQRSPNRVKQNTGSRFTSNTARAHSNSKGSGRRFSTLFCSAASRTATTIDINVVRSRLPKSPHAHARSHVLAPVP